MKRITVIIAVSILSIFSCFAQDIDLTGKTFYLAVSMQYNVFGDFVSPQGWGACYSQKIQFKNDGTYEIRDIDDKTLEPVSKKYTIEEFSLTKKDDAYLINLLGTTFLFLPINKGCYALHPQASAYSENVYSLEKTTYYLIAEENVGLYKQIFWRNIK
jgi:hypothetical protein